MTPIKFKNTCRFEVFSPTLAWILLCLLEFTRKHSDMLPTDGVWITSVNDSAHMKGSKHYSNEALDVRSHNFTHDQKAPFINLLTAMLNSNPDDPNKFDILFEDQGTPNEHFHVQSRKGEKFLA